MLRSEAVEPLVDYGGIVELLKTLPLDRVELATQSLPYERLDQLTMELLMGVR